MHDLALIYFALAHGADDEMAPAESEAIQEKMRTWFPEARPRLIREATEEVLLVYVGASREAMIEAAAASLREALPKELRIGVLNDLADLASVDGAIVPGEVRFIQKLAQYWGVEKDIL